MADRIPEIVQSIQLRELELARKGYYFIFISKDIFGKKKIKR